MQDYYLHARVISRARERLLGALVVLELAVGEQKARGGGVARRAVRLKLPPYLGAQVGYSALTDEMRQAASEALARMGVSHLARRPLHMMSTGEARRVLLARALVTKPRALILDVEREPVGGVATGLRADRDHAAESDTRSQCQDGLADRAGADDGSHAMAGKAHLRPLAKGLKALKFNTFQDQQWRLPFDGMPISRRVSVAGDGRPGGCY